MPKSSTPATDNSQNIAPDNNTVQASPANPAANPGANPAANTDANPGTNPDVNATANTGANTANVAASPTKIEMIDEELNKVKAVEKSIQETYDTLYEKEKDLNRNSPCMHICFCFLFFSIIPWFIAIECGSQTWINITSWFSFILFVSTVVLLGIYIWRMKFHLKALKELQDKNHDSLKEIIRRKTNLLSK